MNEEKFGQAVQCALTAAMLAAPVAADRRDEQSSEKADVNVGHHAIVTRTDVVTQAEILKRLAEQDHDAFVLTEEKVQASRRVIASVDSRLFRKKRVYIVDPLDGSSFRNRLLPEWSISIGVMERGEHVGGVISGPEVLGGFTVVGERGKGVFVSERGEDLRPVGRITGRQRKKSIVFLGLDMHFLPQFADFNRAVAEEVQTTSSTTCALGLAYLAAGRIDALVQPVQAPWDWAAGYPLVEESGGVFQFYHYRKGVAAPLSEPDLQSYDPVKRSAAFIAGPQNLVEWLFALLRETWKM